MQNESTLHAKVLRSLTKLRIPGYDVPKVEESGGRIALPNDQLLSKSKTKAQRKRSLCYTDAIIHNQRVPRILIELVDKNPASPNGITGLTVNVDRIAEIHPNIDLLFVVLAEMKEYFCTKCNSGHRFKNPKTRGCLENLVNVDTEEDTLGKLIHEGNAANFRKALIDYPISLYLHNILPPTVLFLPRREVDEAWPSYEDVALRHIGDAIKRLISTDERSEARLENVRELIPFP